LIEISDLPALNATLNGISAILLTAGYVFIRRGRQALHKKCMLAALVASTAFLTSYVIYHAHTGSRPFPGAGRRTYRVFLHLDYTRRPRGDDPAARTDDNGPWIACAIYAAREGRAMDAANLAVRFSHRRRYLRTALPGLLNN